MAIFNTTLLENNLDYSDVMVTEESGMDILYEFNAGINKVLAATYVADIMIESAVSEGAINVEVLVESSVKDMVRKAQNWFKEFFRKISDWFKRIYLKLTDRTNIISKFAEKNGNKAITNIKNYKGENVTIFGEIYVEKPVEELKKYHEELIKEIKSIRSAYKTIGSDRPLEDSEFFNTNVGSKLNSKIYKKVKVDRKFDDEITISEPMVKYAIDVCKDSPNVISYIKTKESDTKKEINQIINKLEKLQTKGFDNSSQALTSIINSYKVRVSELYKFTNIFISEYQKIIAQNFKILKKAYSLKPQGDGKEKTTESSIFESAYSLI